jgi:hypothetical protein
MRTQKHLFQWNAHRTNQQAIYYLGDGFDGILKSDCCRMYFETKIINNKINQNTICTLKYKICHDGGKSLQQYLMECEECTDLKRFHVLGHEQNLHNGVYNELQISEDFSMLIYLLTKCVNIEYITFLDTKFSSDQWNKIFECISLLKKVKSFSLCHTNLKIENLDNLCQMIKKTTNLVSLQLWKYNSNYINNDWAKKIFVTIEEGKNEHIRYISYNDKYPDYDVNQFESLWRYVNKNQSLVYLEISLRGEEILCFNEHFKHNKTLEYLGLDCRLESKHCEFDSYDAWNKTCEILAKHPKLKHICMNNLDVDQLAPDDDETPRTVDVLLSKGKNLKTICLGEWNVELDGCDLWDQWPDLLRENHSITDINTYPGNYKKCEDFNWNHNEILLQTKTLLDCNVMWRAEQHINQSPEFKSAILMFMKCLKVWQKRTGIKIPKFVIFEIIKIIDRKTFVSKLPPKLKLCYICGREKVADEEKTYCEYCKTQYVSSDEEEEDREQSLIKEEDILTPCVSSKKRKLHEIN